MKREDGIPYVDIDPEVEKRRPKPFRYVSTLEFEKQHDERTAEKSTISVMTNEGKQSRELRESFPTIVGIGDVSTIESVLRRHEMKRDKKKEQPSSDCASDMLIRLRDIHDTDGSRKTDS
jgi:hypothetical protein